MTTRTREGLLLAWGLVSLFLAGCGDEVTSTVDRTPPDAHLTASPTCGPVPLEVAFDASASGDDESRIIGYAWDFTADGIDDTLTIGPSADFTYAEIGTVYARVRVTNEDSLSSTAEEEIWVLAADADPSICVYRNQRVRSVRGIEYTLGLDRHVYGPSDTVHFFYRIQNRRLHPVEFTFHWTCHVDFYVFAGTCSTLFSPECQKVWRLTDYETCTARLEQVEIPPDGTEQFTSSWVPRFSLDPGAHTAFGMLFAGPPSPNDSTLAWVPFEVDPAGAGR